MYAGLTVTAFFFNCLIKNNLSFFPRSQLIYGLEFFKINLKFKEHTLLLLFVTNTRGQPQMMSALFFRPRRSKYSLYMSTIFKVYCPLEVKLAKNVLCTVKL